MFTLTRLSLWRTSPVSQADHEGIVVIFHTLHTSLTFIHLLVCRHLPQGRSREAGWTQKRTSTCSTEDYRTCYPVVEPSPLSGR